MTHVSLSEFKSIKRLAASRKAKRKDNARFIAKVSGKKRRPSLKSLENKLWDLDTLIVKGRDGRYCKTCPSRLAYFGETGMPNLGYAQCHIVPQNEGRALVYDLSNKYFGCEACNASENNYRGRWQRVIFPQVFGVDLVAVLWERSRQIVQLRRPDLERMIAERTQMLAEGLA